MYYALGYARSYGFIAYNALHLEAATCTVEALARGGSAGIRILYTYVTSSGDIHYDNRSYAVVVQRKSCARRQISAPSVPSCVHANDLSFKICVFQVVKGLHNCRDRCYCSRRYVKSRVQLQTSEIGEIQASIAHERRVLSRPDLHQIKDLFLCFLKILT